MDTTVVPPQSGVAFVKQMKSEKKKDFDAGDKNLEVLSRSPGWKDLKGYIKRLRDGLKPQIDLESKSDDDMYKSYGMKMVMYDLVAEQLNSIINRVEDAAEEVGKTRK